METIDAVSLFDSHRRELLERHFGYTEGHWRLEEAA